jgi:5-oxoprolinase (ATP-hydrolysing)
MIAGDGKFHFSIDRGGTFTDVHCRLPDGTESVSKLLSEDPTHYPDAPTEGIRRVLAAHATNENEKQLLQNRSVPVCTARIGSIRMGTTVATNALLERQGSPMALLTTAGFEDVLQIGNQARPDIFDLTCAKPSLLYKAVVGISERICLAQYAPVEWKEQAKYPVATGITGEDVFILQPPNLEVIRLELETLRDAGITSLAIALLHAYVYPEHEVLIGNLAMSMQCFSQISLSHATMPMMKLVSRGHTTAAAAYLTPKITQYLDSFQAGFDDGLSTSSSTASTKSVPLTFMKSDGGLAPVHAFGGHQAILSGPAGGVVGYAKTTFLHGRSNNNKPQPVIGFDMGGTSTDVSRYNGHSYEHVLESVTAGVAIQAPQLDIHTVAAGGGSRLFLKRGMFVVGPESAGAHPGPVCYRKPGGVLAVTDANVALGRVLPQYFPSIFGPDENEPLDVQGALSALDELTKSPEAAGRSAEALAYGFLKVANEAMCRPIRNLTQMKGFDITTHTLACFGGAGPQHACAMAQALGMKKVFVHRHGGVLSAYGLSMADAVHEEQEPAAEVYRGSISNNGQERLQHLADKATMALLEQGYDAKDIVLERYLNMRYHGTDSAIMIPERHDDAASLSSFEDDFVGLYQREYGFTLTGRDIMVDDYRVRAIVPGPSPARPADPPRLGKPSPHAETRAYFETGWQMVPVYKMEDLTPGHEIPGPSIIVQAISTVVLELDCTAFVTANRDLEITIGRVSDTKDLELGKEDANEEEEIKEDPVQLSIFAHRFMGIAEQMGRTLSRTSISVNIKERLDFSCALFTKDGGLVANAPHIPVHLGKERIFSLVELF